MTDAHPGADALLALLRADRGPDAEALLAHVERCGECAELLQHVARCDECADELGVTRPARPFRLGAAGWAGLAAAAGVAWLLLLPTAHAPVRPEPDPGALRGQPSGERPVALEPKGVLLSPPREFRFAPAAGFPRHRILLTSAAGDVVWSSGEAEGDRIAWPPDLRPAPGRYAWQVVGVRGEDSVASARLAIELPGTPP